MKTITLSDKFVKKLISLPETGMGYHDVAVKLKSGHVSKPHTVLNCSQLIISEAYQYFEETDIEDIKLIY